MSGKTGPRPSTGGCGFCFWSLFQSHPLRRLARLVWPELVPRTNVLQVKIARFPPPSLLIPRRRCEFSPLLPLAMTAAISAPTIWAWAGPWTSATCDCKRPATWGPTGAPISPRLSIRWIRSNRAGKFAFRGQFLIMTAIDFAFSVSAGPQSNSTRHEGEPKEIV